MFFLAYNLDSHYVLTSSYYVFSIIDYEACRFILRFHKASSRVSLGLKSNVSSGWF